MTYKDLQKEVGDYTGVYTNLVLEDEMTWNTIGVLTNIIKCDCIGVKPSQQSLALHCNVARSTVLLALGVLRKKGIISKKGFVVNYAVLKVLIEKCNLMSKEITKASKMTENRSNCELPENTENDRNSVKKMTENRSHNINNNKINNNTLYDTYMEDLSKEVKRNTYDMKKECIKPKVQVRVNDLRTPNTKRLSSLRTQIEVAKKDLISSFEDLVLGSEGYVQAQDECYKAWEEYRQRIVKRAIHPKCTDEEYELLSEYYRDTQDLHNKYLEMTADKIGQTCGYFPKVSNDLRSIVHRPAKYEETPEDFGLLKLNEVS